MRVKPILKFGLVAGALALPGAAYPLGLGKLTVDSALGQPLSARIELLPSSREELDSLTARIADPSLYRQNNLTFQGALSRARITLERGPNDVAYLRVTSPTPVSEPFLDLLVEVNWSSGRVVRDYTFLLDPPGAVAQAPIEPVTPQRQGSAPPSRPQPAAAPVAAAPAAAAPAASAPAASAPAAAAPSAPRGDGSTYQVKRGDTLSKIAQEYKPETVTLDQMLVALFKVNQDAFEGGNMNRLRSGAIMTIPNAVEASATQAAEAAQMVRVQASDWRTYRDRVAGAAPLADEGGGRAAAGRIETAVDEKVPAARPGADQLRVSKDAGTAKGAGAAAEAAVARDAALREAQNRITELEKTLKDLQRAVELRNQTLAQLQADAAKAKGVAPSAPSTAASSAAAPVAPAVVAPVAPPVTPPAPAAAAPKAPEPAKVEPPKAAEPAKVDPPKAPEPAKVEPPKAAEPAPMVPAAQPPKAAEPAKVEPLKAAEPPPAPKAAPKAPAKEPPGFFEDMLGSTPPWAIGAGALALLGGIAALVAARRRKTTKFEDSIISGTDIKTNTVFGSTGGGVVNTGENSLASDFSREGLGNIDTDEVDPIAEAEVYLAYGRDAQAEEILKDALKKDPQRQEIYLKLLEIHAQHNKPSAFETVASELYSVTSGQGEVWNKAVALGRQLDPNNPLFNEGGVPAARGAAAGAAAAGAALAFASDPTITRQEPPPGGSDAAAEIEMDEDMSIAPTSGAKGKTPADILAGAESELEKSARAAGETIADKTKTVAANAGDALDETMTASKSTFDSMSAGLSERVEAAKGNAVERAIESARFDLDFQLDDVEKPAPLGTSRGEPALEGAGVAAAPSTLSRPAAALELDKLDLSFDPERSTFEDPTPSVLDGQWHDAATKLDLAKAYQEMGDVEGAREILQEVLHEGDDEQKSEAKTLLAKLA